MYREVPCTLTLLPTMLTFGITIDNNKARSLKLGQPTELTQIYRSTDVCVCVCNPVILNCM